MFSVMILAAGKGTRLKSERPKVLHLIKNKPSLFHVIDLAQEVSNDIIAIVGYKHEEVQSEVKSAYKKVKFALQVPQNGTADAVQKGIPSLSNDSDAVIVLSGDAPALTIKSLNLLIEEFKKNKQNASFIAAKIDDPARYGRVVLNDSGKVEKIVEFIDANEEEKKVKLINSGVYVFNIDFLKDAILKVKKNDNSGEFFLPDLIEIASKENKSGVVVIDTPNEVLGFNTKEQLEILNSL